MYCLQQYIWSKHNVCATSPDKNVVCLYVLCKNKPHFKVCHWLYATIDHGFINVWYLLCRATIFKDVMDCAEADNISNLIFLRPCVWLSPILSAIPTILLACPCAVHWHIVHSKLYRIASHNEAYQAVAWTSNINICWFLQNYSMERISFSTI